MKLGKMTLGVLTLVGAMNLTGCNACTEQHNPTRNHEQFKDESETANQTLPSLKDDGSLPEKAVAETDDSGSSSSSQTNAGVEKYNQFCAACHGQDGAASGPTAAAMNPKPRNFTDASWQASVDDAHIAKVIKEGGAAVGLSPTMAPWGAVVSDAEIKQIVEHIRSFKK